VTLLALLLILWTGLLATVDAHDWFPDPGVKWAWVAFDLLLVLGLFILRARWHDRLAHLLTYAVGADGILTAVGERPLERAAGGDAF
jgi:phosphatidylglycerol lysyltransferase